MTPISERQLAQFYTYKNQTKKNDTYIYIFKKTDTLQKARQVELSLYSPKSRHFAVRIYWNI